MRNALGAAAVLLALLAWHAPAVAEPVKGDFKTKWTTWQTSQKGDWVEMEIGDGLKKRWDVLETSNDGKVKYRETITVKGQEPTVREVPAKHWSALRVTVPVENANTKIEWLTDQDCELGGVKLKCTVARASIGKNDVAEYWYSADVPCDGLIKQTSNGAVSTAVTAFHTEAKSATETGKKPELEPVASSMPRFFKTVGNYAVYKVTISGAVTYQRREVTVAEAASAKYTSVVCDETGKPIEGAKATEIAETAESPAKNFGEVTEKDVKVKVSAGEYTCEKRFKESGVDKSTAFISEGALIKLERSTAKGGATLELIKLEWK